MKFDGPANILFRTVGKPPFIYGTAWKKENTTVLVQEALAAGFTAIDTAAQPRHYREDLVGKALRETLQTGRWNREHIFLQTKFTAPGGQDPNDMPYDAASPLESQIRTSVASSLRNLRPRDDEGSEAEAYIDCLLLHSPFPTIQKTLEAWKVMETYVPDRVKALGISNTSLGALEAVFEAASVKPSVVQNRFYADTDYDGKLRRFCTEKGIVYQSFWTLTGNRRFLTSGPVQSLSKEAAVSKEVAMYALVMELGIAPLNGTSNSQRMKEDLEDIVRLRNWTFVYTDKWNALVGDFKALIERE